MTPFARGGVLRAAHVARSLEPAALAELASSGVLVLAPHPDDETLGCGAALATLADTGLPVHVVGVTDGGGSHPGSARWSRERVAVCRAREFEAAVTTLGEGRFTHESFGLTDQGIPEEDDDPRLVTLLDRTATMVSDRCLGTIWTTWEHDPHPDHVRCAALAEMLADRVRDAGASRPSVIRFPVWGRFIDPAPIDADDEWLRFTPSPDTRARKRRALACHGSQMTPMIDDDPQGFVMPREMQHHFIEHDELFLRRGEA